jgi:AraC family transcriptional regulator
MNSYERIQKAIDYFEDNLTQVVDLEKAAETACFSVAHFYRMFHALVGHTVKEYIRKRRLSEAGQRLLTTDDRLIDVCFDYRFEYQESFTRAFKKMFGVSPGVYRKGKNELVSFPRLDLIEKYYLPGDVNLIDPRIKVLKRLDPIRVAYYRTESESPEREAWKVLHEWAGQNNILEKSESFRIFGFDNPSPKPGNPVYGYEFWLTVDGDAQESEPVRIKIFSGGLYAVTNTTLDKISDAWKNFVRWQKISKYTQGNHQCLEEHLSFPEEQTDKMQIDLYLPIKEPLK